MIYFILEVYQFIGQTRIQLYRVCSNPTSFRNAGNNAAKQY